MFDKKKYEFKWSCPVMDDDIEDMYKLTYGDSAGRAFCRAISNAPEEMAVISRLIAYLDYRKTMLDMRYDHTGGCMGDDKVQGSAKERMTTFNMKDDEVPYYMSDEIPGYINDEIPDHMNGYICTENDDCDGDCERCECNKNCMSFDDDDKDDDIMDMGLMERILKKFDFPDDDDENLPF